MQQFFSHDSHNNLFSFSILLHYKCQSKTNNMFYFKHVKGLQAISKRIKIFEYLRNYIISNGFIFLQKTHPPLKMRRYGMMNLEGSYFSLMVKLRNHEGTVARGPRDPRQHETHGIQHTRFHCTGSFLRVGLKQYLFLFRTERKVF